MKSQSWLGAPLASLLLVAACGGAQPAAPSDPNKAGAHDTSQSDITIEVPVANLEGSTFAPEALGRPGMPLVESKKKITTDKQRVALAKALTGTDVDNKNVQAQILATQLYQAAKSEKDEAKAQAMRDEARKALNDATAGSADKPDSITLRMLGVFNLLAGDFTAAAKHYGTLVAMYPTDEAAAINRTFAAYAALQIGDSAQAKLAIADQVPSEKGAELAYVMAWVKWRTGDDDGAWAAIKAAAKGWSVNSATRSAVERDLMLLGARTGAPVRDVVAELQAFVGGKPEDKFSITVKTSQALNFSGRFADAAVAIDLAFALTGVSVGKNDPAVLRTLQADQLLHAGQPEQTATALKLAMDALGPCGAACDTVKPKVFGTGKQIATLYLSLYATSGDVAYAQPAADIIQGLMIADSANIPEVSKLQESLASYRKMAVNKNGTHDPTYIVPMLGLHSQEILGCYENELASFPTLAGKLVLTIEFSADGKVAGAKADPTAGAMELPAVATCALARARQWTLPARTKLGVTRVTATYQLAPRAAK